LNRKRGKNLAPVSCPTDGRQLPGDTLRYHFLAASNDRRAKAPFRGLGVIRQECTNYSLKLSKVYEFSNNIY